jgi:hypothetical protein
MLLRKKPNAVLRVAIAQKKKKKERKKKTSKQSLKSQDKP